MKATLLFEMKHIKNSLDNITRTIDGTTEAGQACLGGLAALHSQLQDVTDHIKAI